MCCTPAGLCHFLSVYFTAYPPRDYREKKRRERRQERPFPLSRAPAHAHTLALSRSGQKKKKWNLLANVYPLTGGEQNGEGRGWESGLRRGEVTSPLAAQRRRPTPPVNRLLMSACVRSCQPSPTRRVRSCGRPSLHQRGLAWLKRSAGRRLLRW